MKPFRVFAIVGFAALLGALAWSQIDLSRKMNWRTHASGVYSRALSQEMLVLNTENDFDRYWLNYMGAGVRAPQGVNWQTEKLVAIHLGRRATGGYEASIQKIERANGKAHISVIERGPMPGQYVAQGITSPWVIVKVERSSAVYTYSVNKTNTLPGGITIISAGANGVPCSCATCSCACGCGRGH